MALKKSELYSALWKSCDEMSLKGFWRMATRAPCGTRISTAWREYRDVP
jgi:hypothetical protein